MEIKPPYLLFLGDAPDQLAAKTAQGIAYWRPQWCLGQLRLPGCKADLKLTDMTIADAAKAGAKTLVVGVAARVRSHRIAARGHQIALLPEPVWMAFPSQTLGAYLRHELRWAIGIRNIRPGGHFGMLFTHGLPWAVAAACIAPSVAVGAAYLCAYVVLRFAMGWAVGAWGLRDPVLRRRFWLLPLRDFFSFFVWLASFGMNRIEWRGSSFTLEKGRMVPVAPRASRS